MATKKTTDSSKIKSSNYAERMRQVMIKKAEESLNSSSNNKDEFVPGVGSYKIRILPPINGSDFFYYTHSYHWVPEDIDDSNNKNGKYLWTRKNYKVNGQTKTCPFDKAVKQFYAEGRKTNNEKLQKLGSTLKRKRNFFLNILLYDENGENPQFKILIDKTNEGKLVRLICSAMGIPFWRDIEDDWVDKESTEIDPDKEYFDLLSFDKGHDFKIIKKSTGHKPWDMSYEDSFPITKSRPLSDEEIELAKSAIELESYIEYEDDYSVVVSALNGVIGDDEEDYDDEDDVEVYTEEKKVSKKKKAPPVINKKDEDDEDDEDKELEDEELLDELDELDDEDED